MSGKRKNRSTSPPHPFTFTIETVVRPGKIYKKKKKLSYFYRRWTGWGEVPSKAWFFFFFFFKAAEPNTKTKKRYSEKSNFSCGGSFHAKCSAKIELSVIVSDSNRIFDIFDYRYRLDIFSVSFFQIVFYYYFPSWTLGGYRPATADPPAPRPNTVVRFYYYIFYGFFFFFSSKIHNHNSLGTTYKCINT